MYVGPSASTDLFLAMPLSSSSTFTNLVDSTTVSISPAGKFGSQGLNFTDSSYTFNNVYFPSTSFSFSFCYYLTLVIFSTKAAVFGGPGFGQQSVGYYIDVGNGQICTFTSGISACNFANPPFQMRTWRCATITYDSTTHEFLVYDNGQMMITASGSNNPTQQVALGSDNGEAYNMNGFMQCFSMWTNTLSSIQVADLYWRQMNQNCATLSLFQPSISGTVKGSLSTQYLQGFFPLQSNLVNTVTGVPLTTVQGSVSFATGGVAVYVPTSTQLATSSPLNSNFSACVWINPRTWPVTIFNGILSINTNGLLVVKGTTVASSVSVSIGAWTFLCIVSSNDTNSVTVYYNGGVSYTSNALSVFSGPSSLLISGYDTYYQCLSIWTKTLVYSDIYYLYNSDYFQSSCLTANNATFTPSLLIQNCVSGVNDVSTTFVRVDCDPIIPPTTAGFDITWQEPNVLYNGTTWLMYTNLNNNNAGVQGGMMLFTSTDGLSWVAYNGFEILIPNAVHASTVYQNNEYLTYVGPNGPELLRFTSLDGITWSAPMIVLYASNYTAQGIAQWENTQVILLSNGTWVMWVETCGSQCCWCMFMFTSPDSIVWTIANGGNIFPVLQSHGCTGGPWMHAHPYEFNGVYELWCHGTGLYYTTSTDLLNWAVPTLILQATCDGCGLEDASVALVNGVQYLYYTDSLFVNFPYAIGLATALPLINVGGTVFDLVNQAVYLPPVSSSSAISSSSVSSSFSSSPHSSSPTSSISSSSVPVGNWTYGALNQDNLMGTGYLFPGSFSVSGGNIFNIYGSGTTYFNSTFVYWNIPLTGDFFFNVSLVSYTTYGFFGCVATKSLTPHYVSGGDATPNTVTANGIFQNQANGEYTQVFITFPSSNDFNRQQSGANTPYSCSLSQSTSKNQLNVTSSAYGQAGLLDPFSYTNTNVACSPCYIGFIVNGGDQINTLANAIMSLTQFTYT